MSISLMPHLTIDGARKAIEFYKAAFSAKVVREMPAQDGERLMHAELHIGDAVFFLHDDFPEFNNGKKTAAIPGAGSPVTIHMNVPNCDEMYNQAVAAGATGTMPPWDAFWGDRYARIMDPFGHEWAMSHPLPRG